MVRMDEAGDQDQTCKTRRSMAAGRRLHWFTEEKLLAQP
jgi:hypothetical protein